MNAFFSNHLALVDQFLDRRPEIVDRVERDLLNVRDKDTARRRDRPFFDETFSACFFGVPHLPRELSRLKGQLGARHLADGFESVSSERTHVNELDPLELLLRAYEYWEQTRWPGRSGRLTYAQTLYAVFVLRQLEGLSLRIWDDDLGGAADRLGAVQQLLDRLNGPDSPVVLIRDATWLIQTAQGPLTKHLKPYFQIAERITGSLIGKSRLAVHKAGARLAGGHLRSQLRYRVWQTGRPPNDPDNLAFTRNSNALDSAIIVRDLVRLLEAYRSARLDHDEAERLDLTDAILQALSADPELYLLRLDLLKPYVMVEDLFLERADGDVRFSAMGETQMRDLDEYGALIGELAGSIRQDAGVFDPSSDQSGRTYSPLGITYGFCADVMSNMAHETLLGKARTALSLEDMFVSRGELDHKAARAKRWEALPTRPGERAHFDHSLDVAVENHAVVVRALEARALWPAKPNASDRRSSRICVHAAATSDEPPAAVNANSYCLTTDTTSDQPDRASSYAADQFAVDRREGRYLASVQSGRRWFGISKMLLTTFISQGEDAVITNAPEAVNEVLRLTCGDLVIPSAGR